MYTASLTDVTHLRHPEKEYIEQLEAKMKKSVLVRLVLFPDVTMQWTEITAGIV